MPLARLNELGSLDRQAITLLAGLAPIADESGRRQGKRGIKGVRAVCERLVEAGKEKKLALIAVARKLLVLANTLLAENRLWQPTPPHHT